MNRFVSIISHLIRDYWNSRGLFAIVLLATLAVMTQRQSSEIEQINRKIAARDQSERLTDEFLMRAANSQDFLAKLTPREALIWVMLVKKSQEDRNVNGLQEFWATPAGTGIPVLTKFKGDYETAYTVVTGTMVYDRLGGSQFSPCLTFYTGNSHGGCVRLEKLGDDGAAQYRICDKWVSPKEVDFTLVRRDVREKINQHLRLTEQN